MVQLRDQAKVTGPRTSDGIVILTVQRAQGPHPHPAHNGRIVPFNYVSHLLLEDGTERFRCDFPTPEGPNPTCGKDTFTSVKSVPAHMSVHTTDRARPLYPEETLRFLVRTARTYQKAGHPDFFVRTADEMNRVGIPTRDGGAWTAQRVTSLFTKHSPNLRTHVRQVKVDRVLLEKTTTTTLTDHPAEETELTVTAPETTADAATNDEDRRSLAALDRRARELTVGTADLYDRVKKHTEDLADFMSDVADVVRDLVTRPDADPETLDKARRWDEMQKLLTGS